MKNNAYQFHELSHAVIGRAIEVHKTLGPGLLESTYKQCMAHELDSRAIGFASEYPVPVFYKGSRMDCGYRIDMLVENEIIVELKSISALQAIHEAQLLTYMKLAKIRHRLLINFNVKILKNGLKSFIM
jgi:GxxExxY protein